MKLSDLRIGLFDLVVITCVLVGAIRGRKRGISGELLDVIQWLLIVGVGGMFYRPLGLLLLGQVDALSRTFSYVLAYVGIGIGIHMLFSMLKRSMGQKLMEGEAFGDMEYYLGVLAGVVRFCCMLLAAVALLNAKYISDGELAANAKVQRENFGSISFPTLGSLQRNVFRDSWSGRQVKDRLAFLLINSGPEETRRRDTIGRQRERAVDEVISPK